MAAAIASTFSRSARAAMSNTLPPAVPPRAPRVPMPYGAVSVLPSWMRT